MEALQLMEVIDVRWRLEGREFRIKKGWSSSSSMKDRELKRLQFSLNYDHRLQGNLLEGIGSRSDKGKGGGVWGN